jgi:TonB-dependent receptor
MIRIGSDSTRRSHASRLFLSGASVVALCVMSAAAPAFAQDAAPAAQDDGSADDDGAIIITGIRGSLANSQNIKRNADTIVDAITAEDIGALPDRSVTEALSRVPGVAMNRFAGSNDPDHFSVEGSGVVVRGLTYVRSEFNGRDAFSPGVYGQAIGFQDVPADMLGSVEVYKNSTAEMIEGGLSGTVNMNLRRPFDKKGFFLGFSAEAVYTDMRKEWSPVFSIVGSNTWDTGIGRIGVLGAFSYSKLYTRADGVQISNFQTRDGTYAVGSNTSDVLLCRTPLPTSTDQFGNRPNIDAWLGTGANAAPSGVRQGDACLGAAPAGADGNADFRALSYAPLGGQFRTQEFDRTRKGFAGALQWESLDRRALFSAQYLRSDSGTEWGEHTFEAGSDLSEYNTFPAGCRPNTAGPLQGASPNQGRTPVAQCPINAAGRIVGASGTNWQGYPDGTTFPNYQYDSNNIFESGYITLPMGGWRGGNWDHVAQGGMEHTLTRRQVRENNVVNDAGFNFKFAPTERWAINVDAQHVWARRTQLDFSVTGSIFADQELDLTGNYPTITPHKPLTLSQTWASPSPALKAASDSEYFGNPRYTFWRSAMDHIEESTGEEWALKADVQYNFGDDSYLKHVKFGARYADRDQLVKYTTYNWGSLSEVWAGNAAWMDSTGTSSIAQHDWGDFFRGQAKAPPVGNYYTGDLINNYAGSVAVFQAAQAYAAANGGGGAQSWVPLASRPGVIAGTPFLPEDIQPVSESNKSAYAMLSFGNGDPLFGGVTLDGNIGVRFVKTDISSGGSLGFPSQQALNITDPYSVRCATRLPPPDAPPGTLPSTPGGVCTLGPARYAQLQAFATGITTPNTATNSYEYFLPSLNLKFGLAKDLILRFAAGRNLARASMADIRNFLTIGGGGGGSFQLTATAGNPFLKPAMSDNLDASLEWYFGGSGVGSVTLNLFAKNIHNFFYQNIEEIPLTSGGQTFSVFVRKPDNYNQTGKIRGFELSYSQSYDFLPGLLSGFGLSANYTYIDSKGLSNAQLVVGSRAPIGTPGNLPLEQLSKHNFNLQPFYEKGPVSVRLGYTWRSKFLLTASDVIFPYFPIYNDSSGSLDATVFFKVDDHFKVGVQAVNITNEVTKTLQQFTVDGLTGPRSYFMNDRRFHIILRGNF